MADEEDSKMQKIGVPSQGGEPPLDPKGPPKVKEQRDVPKKEELSEEDLALKEALESAVEACGGSDAGAVATALETMAKEIREATSSMTSVPKPLKFLNPHVDALVEHYDAMSAGANKVKLAGILSALSMTRTINGKRELLKYKLEGDPDLLSEWGHEYVRSLAGQVGEEYRDRQLQEPPQACDDLLRIVKKIVPFHFAHNAEPEAVDLLLETEQIGTLAEADAALVTEDNVDAVCLYMLRCAEYLADPEDEHRMLDVAFKLYRKHQRFPDALRVSLRLGDVERTQAVFAECEDEAMKKQMGYMLSRHHTRLVDEDDEELGEIMGNMTLSERFASLAKELDVVEPKTPEQIYKSHLSETGTTAREGAAAPESARGNLASSFVNAFVNAAYCKDKLVTPNDSRWVIKHKDAGLISAAAAHGMIIMWSVDSLTDLDDLLEDSNDNIRAGALLGIGVACAGIRSEMEPAMSLIGDYLNGENAATHNMKMAGLLGMGLAYAGTADSSVMEYLSPFVADDSSSANMELVAMAALALGMVFVGTADETVAAVLADRLMEATDAECNQAVTRQLCVGLGLVFLRQQESVEAMQEVVGTIEHPIGKFANMVLRICAFAGTGNVLEVQSLLHKCAEHPGASESKASAAGDGGAEEGKVENKVDAEEAAAAKAEGFVQSAAVLGIALVTMGDELGVDMAARSAEHLLQYGDAAVRRAVPLSLALHHLSNPVYTIVDTLSKLSHDTDAQVAQNAILALGFVGAGTNNSRIAGLLRQLVAFYKRDADALFCVRVAQALLHMGKGLMTIDPFHSDRLLMSHVAVAGILPVLMCGLDLSATLHSKWHFLLYCLSTAMKPRMLVTVDEDGNELHVDVRVGQAVDTVGQAGKKRSITGFQTHSSPVLLSAGERAELATGEYKALTSVLEGIVVLRKDPEWAAEQAAKKAALERKNARRRTRSRATSSAGAGVGAGAGAAASSS